MEIRINYSQELHSEARAQIEFIRDEFKHIFGRKTKFTNEDRQMAADLLNYLSTQIDVPSCLDYLSDTLEYLEREYPGLF